MSRFSVIVPAHNAETRLPAMLDSIRAQSLTDYELIVVCDACKDKTADVARSYGATVFEVDYHRDGLSRDRGIEAAKGEWILFADDDDRWLHEYCFEILDEYILQTEAKKMAPRIDIVAYSFIFKNRGYAHPLSNGGSLWPAVWSKAWRREFIGDTRFGDRWPDSDFWFTKRMLAKDPGIRIWDMPLYYYEYLRPGSMTATGGKMDE